MKKSFFSDSIKTGCVIIGGHVQGLDLTRSLGLKGIPVVVIDTDISIASKSKFCKRSFKCPDYKSEEFIQFLSELADKQSLKGWILLPTNDFASINISLNKNKLIKYYKFTVPEKKIFDQFYNKKKTVLLAKKTNVHTPQTWFLETLEDILQIDKVYPIVFRGITGLDFYKAFGRKLFEAKCNNDLQKIYKIFIARDFEPSNIMVQEKIPFNKHKRGYYFTSFCVNGVIKSFFMWEKLREHPLRHGTSTWCKSIYIKDLYEQSIAFLLESNYTGVSEIEYLFDSKDKKYKLIEVNARTFLQTSLSRRSGIDYPNMIYNFLNDKEIAFPQEYKSEIHWLHFWTDLFYGLVGVLRNEITLKEYFYPYFKIKNKAFAVLDWNDIKPFLWETILLPYIKLKRS